MEGLWGITYVYVLGTRVILSRTRTDHSIQLERGPTPPANPWRSVSHAFSPVLTSEKTQPLFLGATSS